MAQSHTPVSVEPEALDRAQFYWDGFCQLMKYSTIGVILVLAAMAFFLV